MLRLAPFIVIGTGLFLGGFCRAEECAPKATYVLVHGDSLWLCRNGASDGNFTISYGRSGYGKTQEGDNKTPVGRYPLGIPRGSENYGTFIPVEYPTPEQRKKGYTGADIGIHGPPRKTKWLGRMNAWLDVTRGCVMVASDDIIDKIAAWVKTRHVRLVEIRE